MEQANSRKRSASSSPPPWRRSQKLLRPLPQKAGRIGDDQSIKLKKEQESFAREQTKRNQIQEAEQMREWVSKEDEFVLKQAKKKAQIRVREGRAKPIDWLAVILSVIDPTKDLLEDESADSELDIMDPNGIVEDLNEKELHDLEKDIDTYEILESNRSNQVYWNVRQCMITSEKPLIFIGYEDHLSRPSKSNGTFGIFWSCCQRDFYRCRSSPRSQNSRTTPNT